MFGAEHLKRIIGGLYLRIAAEQEVEDAQIENLDFIRAANFLVDVDRLTGEPASGAAARDMQRAEQQLETTQWIIEDLNEQLDEAIRQWSTLSGPERTRDSEEWQRESLPWPGFPGPPVSGASSSSSCLSPPQPSSGSGWQGNGDALDDPQVGAFARRHHQYIQQWNVRTIRPEELLKIDTNRRSRSDRSTGTFGERLWGSYQHQQQRPVSAKTQSSRPSLGSSDGCRSGESVNFWLSPDYDPFFWEKHLGGRDIWAETKGSCTQVSGQEEYERPISPKTVVSRSWNPYERAGWI